MPVVAVVLLAQRQQVVQTLRIDLQARVLPGDRAGPDIPGHRDFAATECPGGITYALLPTIRQRVAAREGGTLLEDTVAPVVSSIRVALNCTTATLTWATVPSTPLNLPFVTGHRVVLSGLRRGTTYPYRLLSADIAGNRGSSAIRYLTVR